MRYEEVEARKLVIETGLFLVKEELIARTWGNISARISDSEFIITPSGKPYDTLKETDLVKVQISDLSYEGDIKPSSEKKIHAEIYKFNDNVNFVIHTHQNYATSLSLLKQVDLAPIAKYGLPGTKKLKNNVSKALVLNPSSKAILLERHGVICFGESYDEAKDVCLKLESDAKELFGKIKIEKDEKTLRKPYLDDYAQMMGFGKKSVTEDSEAVNLIIEKNKLAAMVSKKVKPMNFFDVSLQHFVYKKKYSKLKDK